MRREAERIAALVKMMPPAERVLEIGARDGRVTRRMTRRHARVVALDLAKPDLRLPGVETAQGDVRDLAPYPDRCFEGVVCSEVLEHVSPADLAPRPLPPVT